MVKCFTEEFINDLQIQTILNKNSSFSNIEIIINDEYILDYEALTSMSIVELENYGITKVVIQKLINRINKMVSKIYTIK